MSGQGLGTEFGVWNVLFRVQDREILGTLGKFQATLGSTDSGSIMVLDRPWTSRSAATKHHEWNNDLHVHRGDSMGHAVVGYTRARALVQASGRWV